MAASIAPPLWPHVHALGVIAQCASFTVAAQRLGLSKAAVSQRISDLERAVGVPLLARTTRSVRLTEAGKRLVDETAASFAQIDHALHAVRDLADHPQGLVRVTAPVALGRQQLAPLLEGFLRAWPGIRVELDLSDRLVNLPHEGYDLAVRHTSAPPDTHVAWKLCDSRTLLVASPDYLKRRGLPAHPDDLAAHDCLTYLRPGPAVWPFEQRPPARRTGRTTQAGGPDEPQRVSVTVGGALRANNSEVLREAALAGLGLALLPDFSAAGALRALRLREVLPRWRPVGFFGDAVYALRPFSPQVPRAVRLLVDHLRKALAEGSPAEKKPAGAGCEKSCGSDIETCAAAGFLCDARLVMRESGLSKRSLSATAVGADGWSALAPPPSPTRAICSLCARTGINRRRAR